MGNAVHIRETNVFDSSFEGTPNPDIVSVIPPPVSWRDGDLVVGVLRIGGSTADELTFPDPSPWTVLATSAGSVSKTYILGTVIDGRVPEFDSFFFLLGNDRFTVSVGCLIRHWSGNINDVLASLSDTSAPPTVSPSWSEETLWITGVAGRTGNWSVDGDGPAAYAVSTREAAVAGYQDTNLGPATDDVALAMQYRLGNDGSAETPGEWLLAIDAGTTTEDVSPHAFTIGIRGDGAEIPGPAAAPPNLVHVSTYQDETSRSEHNIPIVSGGFAGQAGDLVLLLVRHAYVANASLEPDLHTPLGFTDLAATWEDTTNTSRLRLFGRIATDSADTSTTIFTYRGDTGDPWDIRLSGISLWFRSWQGSFHGIDVEVHPVNILEENLDPPELTPYWNREDEVAWIAALGALSSNWSLTAPTDFSDLALAIPPSNTTISRASLATAQRQLRANSIDPSEFVKTGAGSPINPQTFTIGVLGLPAPGPAIALLPTTLRAPQARVAQMAPTIRPASTEYFALLIPDEGSPIPLSISSWQGTLQVDRSNFLQVVVPAPEQLTEIISAIAAGAELAVYQRSFTTHGAVSETQILRVAAEQYYLNSGPRRDTLTVSGYMSNVEYSLPMSWHKISGIRTAMVSSNGVSVRCSIDWNLLPGMEARLFDGTAVSVSYINYYVSNNDAWMQFGDRD